MRFASIVLARLATRFWKKERPSRRTSRGRRGDIEFDAGRFSVKGTDRSVGIFEVAAARPLAAAHTETIRVAAFPYGCQVCEVEVDPDTASWKSRAWRRGRRRPRVNRSSSTARLTAASPRARPGAARGMPLRPGIGTDVVGFVLDYAMPRADHFPSFSTELSEVPSPTNPLGIRAGGEGGTTPALASVANAIVDALAEFGVTHIEMRRRRARLARHSRGRSSRHSLNTRRSGLSLRHGGTAMNCKRAGAANRQDVLAGRLCAIGSPVLAADAATPSW